MWVNYWGGQRVCCPPASQIMGGGLAPPAPPSPPSSYAYAHFFWDTPNFRILRYYLNSRAYLKYKMFEYLLFMGLFQIYADLNDNCFLRIYSFLQLTFKPNLLKAKAVAMQLEYLNAYVKLKRYYVRENNPPQ